MEEIKTRNKKIFYFMFLFIITLFTCGFTYYQANYKQSFDEISVSISDSGSKSITLTKSSSNNVSTLCPVSSANGYEIRDQVEQIY